MSRKPPRSEPHAWQDRALEVRKNLLKRHDKGTDDPMPTPQPGSTPADWMKVRKWMREMWAWGVHVRNDIRDLEARVGLPPDFDPGDPPDDPWD
jgi:hypothetical protein